MAENDVIKIMQALGRIEQKVDTALSATDDHERRLRVLEGRGGKRWDSITAAFITSIVTAIVGYVIGKFL